MSNSNRFSFNPRIYEDQLSKFGKKVLRVLMQQWQSTNTSKRVETRIRRTYHHNFNRNFAGSSRNKKVLNFLDSENVLSCNEMLGLPIDAFGKNRLDQNVIQNSTQLLNLTNEEEKSNGILCIKRSNVEEDNIFPPTILRDQENEPLSENIVDTNVSSLDMEKSLSFEFPELVFSKDKESKKDFNPFSTNNLADDVLPMSFLFEGKICIDDTLSINHKQDKKKNADLDWNNIVDTQLLTNSLTTENAVNNDKMFKLPAICKEKSPVISNANVSLMRSPNPIINTKSNKACDQKITTQRPTCKRKITKITDAIPKKVKKSKPLVKSCSKNVERKKKYTTTVQNWVNEVDPTNEVDDIESLAPINVFDEKTKYEINLEPNKNCAKKIVQAQLKNKGGIMKFDKPKADNVTEVVEKKATKEVTNAIKTVKEKKTKSKFIAPIKSQVPVKELVYDIYNIDCNSINTRAVDLKIKHSEIYLSLTYSNGFNQLNSQFTEDVCLPDAIMLLINENFYFLKGKDFNVMNDIAALVKYNKVVCYGGKIVLKYLALTFDIDVYDVNALDTKIGGSLIDPDNPPENFSNLQKLIGVTAQYTIATECPLQKTAWYLTLLKESTPRLTSLLQENSLWKVFIEIEMAVMPIIASMEMRGILVDSEKLKDMEVTLLNKLKCSEQECYKAAGKKFQINSTVQVRAILYDELQLDTKSNVKIKETVCQGAKSTSETMLKSLAAFHPLPKLILDYRQLHKAHATFLVGIEQHVKNDVIRPTWEQTAAATGRIAANNPNIQAIPKSGIDLTDISVADRKSQEVSGTQHLNFRSIYTSRPGFVFLAADFNHVECRVFAHAAADSSLTELLATGRDLFKVLAAKWLNKSEDNITTEDRERTKRIVYASLYGAGARKLTDILGVSYDQALTVFSSFNRTFPSLKSFGRSVVARCSRDGGTLSTLCGRVRRFAHIDSTDAALKSQAERQAVNFIVQGSAADLCKLAMVRTVHQLRTAGLEAYLLLTIHDELVWEIREDHVNRAADIIKSSMEGCGVEAGAGGRLPVTLRVGGCWGDMTTYP